MRVNGGVVGLLYAAGECTAMHEALVGVGCKHKGDIGYGRPPRYVLRITVCLGAVDHNVEVIEPGTVRVVAAAVLGCVNFGSPETNLQMCSHCTPSGHCRAHAGSCGICHRLVSELPFCADAGLSVSRQAFMIAVEFSTNNFVTKTIEFFAEADCYLPEVMFQLDDRMVKAFLIFFL